MATGAPERETDKERQERDERERREREQGTRPTPQGTPAPAETEEGGPGEPKPAEPDASTAARQAKMGVTKGSRKEDATTVTPVFTRVKEEMTVGGRYEKLTQDRIARRDGTLRFNVAVCPTCGHEETLPPGSAPRTTYMVCPVCGDTLRFTGVGVRDPKAEPLPAIADDEMRAPVERAG